MEYNILNKNMKLKEPAFENIIIEINENKIYLHCEFDNCHYNDVDIYNSHSFYKEEFCDEILSRYEDSFSKIDNKNYGISIDDENYRKQILKIKRSKIRNIIISEILLIIKNSYNNFNSLINVNESVYISKIIEGYFIIKSKSFVGNKNVFFTVDFMENPIQ